MSSLNNSPRHHPHPSSRPIGIRPEFTYPRFPQSNTPPYTSADELRPPPSHTRPLMMPRPSYPTFNSAGPSGSSTAPMWMDPRHLPGTPHPPYSPPQFGSLAPEFPQSYSYYPNTLYTDAPYIPQPFLYTPVTPAIVDPEMDGTDSTRLLIHKVDDSDSIQQKLVKSPPRPPNAWIIYRSDMLRAIARGDHMPKLDAAMAESGISSGESPAGEEGAADSSDKDAESGDEPKKPKKKIKKPKKGSKVPTAGMLSLGKGKTGRGIPQADVSKLISLMWAREEPSVKKKYENQSAQHKKEHQEKYPDYKFQPLKRADKLRMREEKEREKAEVKLQKQADKQAEKLAGGGHPGAKRKGRSRLPPPSPYASAMARTKSTSTPTPEAKDEPEFSMYPFPIPRDALPSLQGGDLPDPSNPQSVEEPLSQVTDKAQRLEPTIPPPPPLMYPAWADMPDLGPAYAIPYIFEPIPIPGEDFNMDLLQPFDEADADADALAALWCSVEEEEGDPNVAWDMTSSETMQAWSELGSYPQYPANLELSSSIAEQIAQDWTATLPPDYASHMQPVYDPALNLIQVPYYEMDYSQYPAAPPVPNFTRSGPPPHIVGTSGPFLSANQPLSPVEPWSSQGNPDAMPFCHLSTGSNRLASSSSHGSDRYPTSPDFSIPRHISSSAFPASSLSVDASGWTDRSVSFSAFSAQAAGDTNDLLWDVEGDGRKGGDEFGGLSTESPNTRGAPTPIEYVSSISNTPESASDAHFKGPPRNVRRARTVGAAFADSS